MGRAGIPLLLLAVSCASLHRAGGPFHVERGEIRTVREVVARHDYAIEWREPRGDTILFDVVSRGGAMPAPLEVAATGGRATMRIRFPYLGGSLGGAVLAGHAPLDVEEAIVEAVWLPGSGLNTLHPVAELRLAGPLTLDRWVEAHVRVAEDPAPARDLVDDVADPDLRFRLARGVGRVMRLDDGAGSHSTWELAAVTRSGREVRDWQTRVRAAYEDGRLDALRGCRAVIREHAFGARRGIHVYELPLVHVLLASDLEREGDRWKWGGLVAIENAPVRAADSRPSGMPPSTFRLVVLRDRRYRHGPPPLVGAILGAVGYAGAWLVERGLGWHPGSDGWSEWFRGWSRDARGQAYRRRHSGPP